MATLQSNIQISDGKLIMPLKDISLIKNMQQLKELINEELTDMEDMKEVESRKDEPLIKAEGVYKTIESGNDF